MTTTTKVGDSLTKALRTHPDAKLRKVVTAVADASVSIAALCRTGGANQLGSANAFGDQQLEIDMKADAELMHHLRRTGVVAVASSEEQPREIAISNEGVFAVAFDPLDGSSIIGCNFAVGSIVGVWSARSFVGVDGRGMVASVVTQYGPRTTMFVALGAMEGVWEFTLLGGGWVVTRVVRGLREGRLFAPANLRCAKENEGYKLLVEHYMAEGYTLRYTGGMVPDVLQILVKGYGVFVSPVSEGAPAKLRLLYEAMPMAFLMECCGGGSSDGKGSVLDRRVTGCDERTAVCIGTVGEVDKFERYCA